MLARCLCLAVLTLTLGAQAPLAQRRAALTALLAEQWEYTLRTSPETASILGDPRYNDRLSDYSPAAIRRDQLQTAGFLKRFEQLDCHDFPVQERLNQELMVRQLRLRLEGARFKEEEMPVFQNSGLHLELPQLVSDLSFTSTKDYQDYLARLRRIPRAFAQTTALMRKGLRDGLMPPRFLLPVVAKQCEDLAAMPLEASPFAQPVAAFPAAVPQAEQARLKREILQAIRAQVVPAYLGFAAFVRAEYAPKGRKEPGLWSLPHGQATYAYKVKVATTTDLTPEAIHETGLKEVARIEGRMLEVARKLGFQDLDAFNTAARLNPALHPASAQALLGLYQTYTDQMYAKLPLLFGRLPKGRVIVKAVQAFRAKGAPSAEYNQGTPDGSRPGQIMINTDDFQNRLSLNVETTAYHEGVPGHHLQIALAQELEALPPFRQQGSYVVYEEGWALYAERLGEEVGFYQDPYSYYGHLQDEMLRAIRLVVDTGLHAKHWTRQQVVDFFHAHGGGDEVDIQSETDRYIVWPGQALGYKVGEMKLLELREQARRQLGPKFDLRAFHDVVLGSGALPMDVLERQVKAWVQTRQ